MFRLRRHGLSVPGYPIRKPPGLSSLAALRGFSQLAASFFACRHQGIHHKPLGSSSEPRVAHLKLSEARFRAPHSKQACFVCLILVIVLYSWKLCFPQNCWRLPAFSGRQICNFAMRMSICRLPALRHTVSGGFYGGKGTRTPDIQLAKLALYQLSYAPMDNLQFTIDD